jgi:ATP-dependent Clp protease protease subunit
MPKNKSYIGIKNEAETSTLELHFTDFIYDGFNWDTWETTNLVQETINKIKAANPSKIKVVINSLGGDVMIGLALYNYIKAYKAEKEVDVLGFAASIASIMAMVADPGKLRMGKSTFMIIHAAWSYAAGNAKEMRKQADDLDKVTNELASIYAQRSGKEASYFTDLWEDGDYWMTATEAKEIGLADEIYNSEPVNAKVDFSNYNFRNVPAALLNSAEAPPVDESNPIYKFFNKQYMKLMDKLNSIVNNAKTDKKFEKIENRDAVLDMVMEVFKPFAEAADAGSEEKPAEEKKEDTKPAETKPAETTATETKPAEEKKDEGKKDDGKKEGDTKEQSEDMKDLMARFDKLEKENANLRAAVAGQQTKPGSAKASATSSGFNKAKIEYAE